MPRLDVSIETRDGVCPASIFVPAGSTGPWPAVIFFMDGLGIRPTLWEMGQRLADGGYLVLMPDLYYRFGPYLPSNPSEVFADPKLREELMTRVGSLDRDKKVSDTGAFIKFLANRPDVAGHHYGATGYCMGGNFALTAAGAFPEQFAAAASFHGGGLAIDHPDSPHAHAKAIKAEIYVGGAVNDPFFTDDQKLVLEQALTAAGVKHVVETYPGALHGFAVPDLPVYDQSAAERHWTVLFKLFPDAFARAAIEQEIRDLENARAQALLNADWNALAGLIAEDLVHIHANGSIETKPAYLETVSTKLEFLRVERPGLTVRVYGDIAIATGLLDQEVRVKGPGVIVTMRAATTQVWIKTPNGWLQNSFQATRLDH